MWCIGISIEFGLHRFFFGNVILAYAPGYHFKWSAKREKRIQP